MYRFHCTQDFNRGGVHIEAGNDYILEDINAGEMIAMELGHVGRHFSPVPELALDPVHWSGGKLLLIRPGGFGDLLFLTPIIRALRKACPTLEVGVCAFPRYLSGIYLEQVQLVPYPLHAAAWAHWGNYAYMENVVERYPEGRELHIVDALASRVPMPLAIEDYSLSYTVTGEEREIARHRFPRDFRRQRVGIQLRASSHVRTYPVQLTDKLIFKLVKQSDMEVVLLGAPGELPQPCPEHIINLTMQDPPLSMRESVAVLETCDALVAPDSAMTHFAGALGVPCVGLYGPFPWELRTRHQATTFALSGRAPCAPCHHHVRGGQHFPADKPCARDGVCVAMASIDPDRIVREVKRLIHEREQTRREALA